MPSVPCRRLAKPGPKTQLMWNFVAVANGASSSSDSNLNCAEGRHCWHFLHQQDSFSSLAASAIVTASIAHHWRASCRLRKESGANADSLPQADPDTRPRSEKPGDDPPRSLKLVPGKNRGQELPTYTDSDYPTHLEPSHRFAAPLSNPPHGAGRQHCGCDVLPVSIGTAVDSPP